MSGDRAILNLRRPFAHVHHPRDATSSVSGSAVRTPHRPTRAQPARHLLLEQALALHEDRFVDGFVGHPHLRVLRELLAQLLGDLFGAVLALELGLDTSSQLRTGVQLQRLRPSRPLLGVVLGHAGSIGMESSPRRARSSRQLRSATVAARTVPIQLAGDGRWRSAQASRDLPFRHLALDEGGDLLAFLEGETPWGAWLLGRNWGHTPSFPEQPTRVAHRQFHRRRRLGDREPPLYLLPERSLDSLREGKSHRVHRLRRIAVLRSPLGLKPAGSVGVRTLWHEPRGAMWTLALTPKRPRTCRPRAPENAGTGAAPASGHPPPGAR